MGTRQRSRGRAGLGRERRVSLGMTWLLVSFVSLVLILNSESECLIEAVPPVYCLRPHLSPLSHLEEGAGAVGAAGVEGGSGSVPVGWGKSPLQQTRPAELSHVFFPGVHRGLPPRPLQSPQLLPPRPPWQGWGRREAAPGAEPPRSGSAWPKTPTWASTRQPVALAVAGDPWRAGPPARSTTGQAACGPGRLRFGGQRVQPGSALAGRPAGGAQRLTQGGPPQGRLMQDGPPQGRPSPRVPSGCNTVS